MLRRKKSDRPEVLRDRAKALMQQAAAPDADLPTLAAEAGEVQTGVAQARQAGADTDLLDEAERYLAFVTAMADRPAEDDLHADARALDDDVLAAAREVAGGRLVDEPRSAALQERMDALIARARDEDRLDELGRLLHDARLDLTYVRSGGRAPTSLRLAHERPR